MTPSPRFTALVLLACACGFPPIDYTGKSCPDGACPAGYRCLEGVCQPGGGGGGGGGEGGGEGGGGGASDAGAGGDGGTADGGDLDGGELLEVWVSADEDDATWTGAADPPTTELLFVPGTGANVDHLEVGSNNANARGGLRFPLNVPRNATIDSATLTLTRLQGNAAAADTIQVQTWDTASVPPFDAGHVHSPADHGGGLAPGRVNAWALGAQGPTTSPSLASLVQHVVDRADWDAGGFIGFVLSPDSMSNKWVAFEDVRTDGGLPDGGSAAGRLTVHWH